MTGALLAAALLAAADAITREGARDAARDELRDPAYHADEPSLADRAVKRVLDFISDRIDEAARIVPGGGWGLLVVLVVVGLLVTLVLVGAGPLRRRDALTDRRRGASELSAADYRAEAERLAAAGEWKAAVRARFRAVVRELEQRAVLDPRPGRTAGEVASEAGALVPLVAGDLRSAADVFGAVWYGGRPANSERYAEVVRVDDVVRGSRLTVLSS